jgi:hypothetical protein
MEKPGAFAVKFQDNFIIDLKGTKFKTGKLPQHLIMIPGEVNDLGVPD